MSIEGLMIDLGMDPMKKKPSKLYYGTTWFTLPFRSRGYYVEDATGKEVAEAKSLDLAKALAATLNTLEPTK